MLSWRVAVRSALFAATGILLAQQGIGLASPVFWIVMIAMAVAGLLGYEEGRADV